MKILFWLMVAASFMGCSARVAPRINTVTSGTVSPVATTTPSDATTPDGTTSLPPTSTGGTRSPTPNAPTCTDTAGDASLTANPVVTGNFAVNKGTVSPQMFSIAKQAADATSWAAQKSVGITTVRIDFNLDHIIPSSTVANYKANVNNIQDPITWNWSEWNNYGALYHQQGFKILLIADYMPPWLSCSGDNHGVASDWSVWTDIVTKAFTHIQGQYDYVEIWNEPVYFLGASECQYKTVAAAYVDLYAYTAKAVRTADSKALIGGPVAYCLDCNGPIDGELNIGIFSDSRNLGNINFISFHNYSSDAGTDITTATQWRALAAQYGGPSGVSATTPLFVTEWNYEVANQSPLDGPSPAAVSFDARRLTDQINSNYTYSGLYQEGPGNMFAFLTASEQLLPKAFAYRLLSIDLGLGLGTGTLAASATGIFDHNLVNGAAINSQGQPVAWVVNDSAYPLNVDYALSGLTALAGDTGITTAQIYLASAATVINDASSSLMTRIFAVPCSGSLTVQNLALPAYSAMGVVFTAGGTLPPSTISSPSTFTALNSPRGEFTLTMQADGNLVEYFGTAPVWSSNTYGVGTGPYTATLQAGGNLVIGQSNGSATWSSNTPSQGTAPYQLSLQDNGSLVLTDATGKTVFSNGPFNTLPSFVASVGYVTTLESPDGAYRIVMGSDGNLVEYHGQSQVWSSNTAGVGTAPYSATMQDDGNFVLYQSNGNAIWSTSTYNQGTGPYKITLQNSGNFVITDSTSTAHYTGGGH